MRFFEHLAPGMRYLQVIEEHIHRAFIAGVYINITVFEIAGRKPIFSWQFFMFSFGIII
jgi:hypothetical protein